MTQLSEPPLITVIIAVYNAKATLQQCLTSVIEQTYPRVELIVIDGGSTDGTVDILRKNDAHISYWVSEPDKGIYNAWNKALAKASGDWICFLGADDYLWNKLVLANLAARLVGINATVHIGYGQVMLLDRNEQPLFTLGSAWADIRKRFKQDMCIPHPATMHRRCLFDKHGFFDETFRIAGDYELLLRELKTGSAVFIPDVVVTAMRQGGISSSPQNTLLTLREVRRAQKKMGFHQPGLTWMLAVARVYLRLVLWRVFGERQTRVWLDLGRKIMGLAPYWTRT